MGYKWSISLFTTLAALGLSIVTVATRQHGTQALNELPTSTEIHFGNAARVRPATAVVHSDKAHHQQSAPVGLPLVVDGRTTPELIPDDLAYRHFIMSIAEPRVPTATQANRRHAFLRPVNLSSDDSAVVIRSLQDVREHLNVIAQQRTSLDPLVSGIALENLKIQEKDIFESAQKRLKDLLSEDGRVQLDAYINTSVKTRIRIYGAAPQ